MKNTTKLNDKLNNEPTTVTIDCGQNGATIYDGSEQRRAVKISFEDLFNLPNTLPKGSSIWGERAHYGVPREEDSKAQYFTSSVLLKFYSDCEKNGINLRFYSERLIPKMLTYAGFGQDEKSDFIDPVAAYEYIMARPNVRAALMKPPKSFGPDPLRDEGHAFRETTNKHLNVARFNNYENPNAKWIQDNVEEIAKQLSDTAKSAFGLDEKSHFKIKAKQGKINLNKVKLPQMYSVLATLKDLRGNLRLRDNPKMYNKELPGWKFIKKYVIPMSPFHFRGGVARSNLYHHGMKNWINMKIKETHNYDIKKKDRGNFSKSEDQIFNQYRTEYCNSIHELFHVFKEMITK
jgi:hypothetical protein